MFTPTEIASRADEWNSDDSAALRVFFETKAGRKLLPALLEKTPGLLPGGKTNAICIRNGEVRGVRIIAQALLELANPPPEPKQKDSTYPDLHDDKQWQGEKLNPEEKES